MLTVKTTLSTAGNDHICIWICESWEDDWQSIFHRGIWRRGAFCRSGSLGAILTIHFSGAWPEVVLPRTLSRSYESSSPRLIHIYSSLLSALGDYRGMSCPQVNPSYPRRGTRYADRNYSNIVVLIRWFSRQFYSTSCIEVIKCQFVGVRIWSIGSFKECCRSRNDHSRIRPWIFCISY